MWSTDCRSLNELMAAMEPKERFDLVKWGRPTLCCVICCKFNIDNRYKIVLNKSSGSAIEC